MEIVSDTSAGIVTGLMQCWMTEYLLTYFVVNSCWRCVIRLHTAGIEAHLSVSSFCEQYKNTKTNKGLKILYSICFYLLKKTCYEK